MRGLYFSKHLDQSETTIIEADGVNRRLKLLDISNASEGRYSCVCENDASVAVLTIQENDTVLTKYAIRPNLRKQQYHTYRKLTKFKFSQC